MFEMNRKRITRAIFACLMAFILALSLVSFESIAAESRRTFQGSGVSEVSPPEVIQELRQILAPNQPQVKIISPQPGEVLQDNAVTVALDVDDFLLFRNTKFGLGPHLQVFLDNQPSRSIYDLKQPVTLQDLTPGTHTLQIFAAYPWDESFKNEGAYAQTTFHIFTKTQDNNPDPALPLMAYNRPQGSYGAEPIMLDFYLINAPLHLVAQERSDDDILDWQIRCTINGKSFLLNRWQPIYLKGFRPGKNWVQLEFLDEKGNVIQNVFNSTIRLITYEPGSKDTLSQLVQGELKAADARGIVDPNYVVEPSVPTPVPSPSIPSSDVPTEAPSPTLEPSPSKARSPRPSPTAGEASSTKLPKDMPPTLPEIIVPPTPSEQATPKPKLTPSNENSLQPQKAQESQPLVTPPEQPAAEVELPKLDATGSIEPVQPEKQESDELFNRSSTPSALPREELQHQDLPPLVTPEVEVPQPTSEPTPYSSFKSFWNRYRRQSQTKQEDLEKPQPSTLEGKTAAE